MMNYLDDYKRFEAAVNEVHSYNDKVSYLNYVKTYRSITEKYKITWDQLMSFINITMKGHLSQDQINHMKLALEYGKLEEYRIEVQYYCFRVFVALAVFGILGNTSIMAHFIRQNIIKNRTLSKMKAYHFLVTLLALVDALYCGFLTFSNYNDWQNSSYPLSEFACVYAMPFAHYIFPYLSLWLVAFISYERYKNIVHPFAEKTTVKIYAALSFGVICICAGLTYAQIETLSPLLHGEPGRYNCYPIWDVDLLNFHLTFLFGYALPLLSSTGFMLYYYFKISRYMQRESRRVQNVMEVGERIQKRNKKALKVLLFLILIFILTIMPARSFYY
eukprot:TCONS_00065697-protein